MDDNQQSVPKPMMTEEQMLKEIYENTRKTKNYMKWQLYITVALVVLPILAMAFLIPTLLKSLGSMYGAGGLLQ